MCRRSTLPLAVAILGAALTVLQLAPGSGGLDAALGIRAFSRAAEVAVAAPSSRVALAKAPPLLAASRGSEVTAGAGGGGAGAPDAEVADADSSGAEGAGVDDTSAEGAGADAAAAEDAEQLAPQPAPQPAPRRAPGPASRSRPTPKPPYRYPFNSTNESLTAAAIVAAPTLVTPENKVLEESGVRLYITTVTGSGYEWRARLLQKYILPHLGPRDVFSHTCEAACVRGDHGLVGNMVEIPEMPDGILNLKVGVIKCAHAHGYCRASHVAQAKFPFGIIHEVRRMQASGNPMPKWWMVRDDDTYMHVEHLMSAIEAWCKKNKLREPYHEQVVCFTPPCGLGTCGGGGWIMTAAFAEQMINEIGDKWMQFQVNRVRKGMPHYDLHIKKVLTWMDGWKMIKLPEMNAFAPNSELCSSNPHVKCVRTPICNCSQSATPSSWHMNLHRDDIEKNLAMLAAHGY